MKFAGILLRSLQPDMQTELRGIEGAVAAGTREAGRGQDRPAPSGCEHRAFDEGAVIRSRRGRFLAIPTENAPRKGTDGRRISPSTFPEYRFGPLRLVLGRADRRSCGGWFAGLVQPEDRGAARLPTRDRSGPRTGRGLTTVVMFLLVPQVKLRKRLDVNRAAAEAGMVEPLCSDRVLDGGP
jgi:hypothetical protein